MGKSAFQAGVEVEINGKKKLLLRKVGDEIWQLEDMLAKRIQEYSDTDLRGLYAKGELTFVNGLIDKLKPQGSGKPHCAISDQQWVDAKIRRAYVIAVLGLPNTRKTLKPIVLETWKSLGQPGPTPSVSTVIRWRRKYENSGHDIVSLVDQSDKKGNRKERYPTEVIDITQKAIETVYLTEERKDVQAVVDRALVLINNENDLRPSTMQLPRPARRLIQRLIAAIPAYDRCAARHGRTTANKRFRSVLGYRVVAAPLERAEIDHTLLDLMVIDEETGLPLGRPYITVCIDDYSRCILGIYIGFEPPSYQTVAYCLKHAFRPKTDLKELYPDIKNAWDAHGVMNILVVDNGAEFHSTSLENACYSMGIELHYSARKTPWYKGKIERFLGTLNRDVAHGVPGTTFSNIFNKEEYDPSKHAVIRLSKLREIIYMWVVDVYHQRVHRTLKAPPAVVWKSSISPEVIHLPDDPARLDAIMGRSEERRLTHKGIELNKLFYNSPELTELRRKLGDALDVEVRVDDSNIGSIYVFSPDKTRMFKVPALNLEYADGLSAWQHRVCKRFAAREMGRYDAQGWLAAKLAIATLIDEEFMHKKRKTRARIARYKGDAGRSSPTPPAPLPLPAPTSSAIESPTFKTTSEPLTPEDIGLDKNVESSVKRFKPIYRDRTQNPNEIHEPVIKKEPRDE